MKYDKAASRRSNQRAGARPDMASQCLLIPHDGIEQGPQFCGAGEMDVRCVGEAAQQVGAEIRVGAVVLGSRAMTQAICQDRFELVSIKAGEGSVLIENEAGGALGDAGRHDFGFSVGG